MSLTWFKFSSRRGDVMWEHIVLLILFLVALFLILIYFDVTKRGIETLIDRLVRVLSGRPL